MKPTVYIPLADLCPTGLRRLSRRSAMRFATAGRISAPRLWVERQGRQVGRSEHQSIITVAGKSEGRRIA